MATARGFLAPEGKLRVGINSANKLLVKSDDDGIAPVLGRRLAEEIGAECILVPFDSPGSQINLRNLLLCSHSLCSR